MSAPTNALRRFGKSALYCLAGITMLAAGGCAFVPREPLVQLPTTARAEPRPVAPATGSIFQSAYAGNPLF